MKIEAYKTVLYVLFSRMFLCYFARKKNLEKILLVLGGVQFLGMGKFRNLRFSGLKTRKFLYMFGSNFSAY